MVKAGVGLKPLIAVYLIFLLAVCAGLTVVAAVRLSRHAMVAERVFDTKELLRQWGERLNEMCPDLSSDRLCRGFSVWTKKRQELMPSLLSLSLLDGEGKCIVSSDPGISSGAMWDGLGPLGTSGPSGEGWRVEDLHHGRRLLVEVPVADGKWVLKAWLSLAQTDRLVAFINTSASVYAVVVAAALALLGWLFLYRMVVRPVERLLYAADKVSEQGDLSLLMSADNGSELGRLGVRLGRMARRIKEDQSSLQHHISKLQELNRNLTRAQEALVRQEKLASVGLLAAGLAHEIGNPMAAIIGYVDMLRTEEFSDSDRGDILARVGRELERIDKIIRDLLAFSRPGRGEIQPCNAYDLIQQVRSLLVPQKKFKTISFEVQVANSLPAALCDPDLVSQVLINLCLNSLDALGSKGHLWIRVVSLERSEGGLVWNGSDSLPDFFELGELHQIMPPNDGRDIAENETVIVFCVVDDGSGMEKKDISRIFDPFFTTKPPGKGTGLGLAICHTAVESMDGQIWAWSKPGLGTQVAFWVPAAAGEK